MSTLLLRLAAPMQSWGNEAKFDRRGTERVPTKSGVIGMIASALGRARNESVEDLSRLKFGVRVDKEGTLIQDFHTVRREKSAYVTNRYYLADAIFLAGLEGEEDVLHQIDQALKFPAYPLYLGRRSCPPEGRISLGIRKGKPLLEALRDEPPLTKTVLSEWRLVHDALPEDRSAYMQRDLPLSYHFEHRKYGFRRVSEQIIRIDQDAMREPGTDHDPFPELGG